MNMGPPLKAVFGVLCGLSISLLLFFLYTYRENIVSRPVTTRGNLKTHSNSDSLYPDPARPWEDRIFEQLAYKPPYNITALKTIMIPMGSYINLGEVGRKSFYDYKCTVNDCLIVKDNAKIREADLILLTDIDVDSSHAVLDVMLSYPIRPDQIWTIYIKESPRHLRGVYGNTQFNWTIAYTPSSTLPVLYSKYYPLNPNTTTLPQTENYAQGKTGKVLWFVSNCQTPNDRMNYVYELRKHIQVDIYGDCGIKECKAYGTKCMLDLFDSHKFYLAFENSNCDTYVTEKFFSNGLKHDILPVVMGAWPTYYKAKAPTHSYIHVEDFKSPQNLAEYLHKLDRNDDLYNEYFQWKGAWAIVPENTIICRLCAMLHAPKRTVINTNKNWTDTERCRGPIPLK